MIKGIAVGVIATLAAGLLGAYLFISMGGMPANADAKPPRWERWAAHKSLSATLAREAPKTANPVALNDANMIAAVKTYAVNCAVCHGGPDAKPSNVAKGFYQHAPQFAKHDMSDDEEGETFWTIDHGIRMTAMPSYRATLSETQIWQLALFLKHMHELTPGEEKAWKAVPSQAARS